MRTWRPARSASIAIGRMAPVRRGDHNRVHAARSRSSPGGPKTSGPAGPRSGRASECRARPARAPRWRRSPPRTSAPCCPRRQRRPGRGPWSLLVSLVSSPAGAGHRGSAGSLARRHPLDIHRPGSENSPRRHLADLVRSAHRLRGGPPVQQTHCPQARAHGPAPALALAWRQRRPSPCGIRPGHHRRRRPLWRQELFAAFEKKNNVKVEAVASTTTPCSRRSSPRRRRRTSPTSSSSTIPGSPAS